MYGLSNDAVPGDSVIKERTTAKVRTRARGQCTHGQQQRLSRRASATSDDYSEPLSILCTDHSYWETLCFPGTAIRFHPCCRFSREQMVHHRLLVLRKRKLTRLYNLPR